MLFQYGLFSFLGYIIQHSHDTRVFLHAELHLAWANIFECSKHKTTSVISFCLDTIENQVLKEMLLDLEGQVIPYMRHYRQPLGLTKYSSEKQ